MLTKKLRDEMIELQRMMRCSRKLNSAVKSKQTYQVGDVQITTIVLQSMMRAYREIQKIEKILARKTYAED